MFQAATGASPIQLAHAKVYADGLCAGENATDLRWSRRCFKRPSHTLIQGLEMRIGSNSIDR